MVVTLGQQYNVGEKPTVELAPNQVIGEMVLDGGGHFIPAGIFGLHTLYLLLSSQVVHDRATEVTHQYKRPTHLHT